jgi:carbon starvation protein
MNSAIVGTFAVAAMLCGYVFYSKFIATKILALDNSRPTLCPNERWGGLHSNKEYVLWGHHLRQLAGAAPIIGPTIAVIWGLGACHHLDWYWALFFMAGVHDMSAIWASGNAQ